MITFYSSILELIRRGSKLCKSYRSQLLVPRDKFISHGLGGVPPRPTSHERLNVIIYCAFYHCQIIAPYLHPGVSTLRKFVKNLMLQSCMI